MRKVAVLLLAVLSIPGPMFGQQTTASLSGTVTDLSGAIIPEAHVTATAAATGATSSALSNREGFYILTGLLPGVFSLQVEKAGFQRYAQSNIVLQVDRPATINVSLTVGSLTQTVTVTGAADQVNLRSQTINYVITSKMITELPLNGRNVTQLIAVAPDAGPTGGGNFYQNATRPEMSVLPGAANGGNGRSTAFYLDGGAHEDNYTEGANIYPNPDAIQEFGYETNNYSAKFGGRGGGVMNAVTRGGANQFHGTAFEFVRNTALNARNFFASSTDGLKRNQYGFTLGGPIKKDNTFFFFSLQDTLLRSAPTANLGYALTAAQRNGDFTAPGANKVVPLHDPNTGLPFVTPNVIPTAEFNPISVKELAITPIGNPGTGQVRYSSESIQNTYQYVTRVDHNFGTKYRLYGTYLNDHLNQPSTEDPKNILTAARPSTWKSQTATLNLNYTLRPNLVASFVAAVSRRGYLTEHPGPPKGLPGYQDLGMQGVPKLSPAGQTESIIRVGGYMDAVLGGAAGINYGTQQNYGTHWTYIKSLHTFEFGGEFEINRQLTFQDFLSDGYTTFSGLISGDNAADFLLGKPNFFEQAAFVYRAARRNNPAMYFMDTWKATRRLTWSLGVRWNPLVPENDANGKQALFSPSAYQAGISSAVYPNLPPGLLMVGDPNLPPGGVFPNHNKLFQPRVGFAYDPFGKGTTSIRGGYGIYTDQMAGIDGSSSYSPFTLTAAVNYPISYTAPFVGSGITNPFPIPGNWNSLGKGFVFPLPMAAQPYYPGMKAPIVQQWNLTLEHQLPEGVLARVGYEGSEAYHVFGGIEINQCVYDPTQTQAQQKGTCQQRRPRQQYTTLQPGKTIGTISYNALVASVEKRTTHGLTGLAGYRWSKCLDEGEGVSLTGTAYSTNNPAYDRGRCSYDVLGQFLLSDVYQLPEFEKLGFVGHHILGGWSTSSILTLRTGFGYGASYSTDNALIGGGGNRANPVPGVNPNLSGGRSLNNKLHGYFNTAAFVENPVGTLGTSGKAPMTGPGFANIDFMLTKSFPIHYGHFGETQRLDFRAESFNLFNRANFGNPNGNLQSSTVGWITSAQSPRILQFALKFVF